MTHFSFKQSATWCLCALVVLALAGQPATVAAQTPVASASSTTSYPVLLNVRGQLVGVFFATGEYVKRGQLLAKIERPDGSSAYVSAPVSGRITAAKLPSGESLTAHTVLALVEVLPAAKL